MHETFEYLISLDKFSMHVFNPILYIEFRMYTCVSGHCFCALGLLFLFLPIQCLAYRVMKEPELSTGMPSAGTSVRNVARAFGANQTTINSQSTISNMLAMRLVLDDPEIFQTPANQTVVPQRSISAGDINHY